MILMLSNAPTFQTSKMNLVTEETKTGEIKEEITTKVVVEEVMADTNREVAMTITEEEAMKEEAATITIEVAATDMEVTLTKIEEINKSGATEVEVPEVENLTIKIETITTTMMVQAGAEAAKTTTEGAEVDMRTEDTKTSNLTSDQRLLDLQVAVHQWLVGQRNPMQEYL